MKYPSRSFTMLKSLLFCLLLFVLACGSNENNPVAPPHEHEPLVLVDGSAALAQLFNIYNPDIYMNLISTPDDSSVVTFQTATEFRYTGATNIPISVVRGIIVWYQDVDGNTEDIGTSTGFIVDADGLRTNVLIPNHLYYYLCEWDGDTFYFFRPDGFISLYTNFYALNNPNSPISLSKRAGQINQGQGRRFR